MSRCLIVVVSAWLSLKFVDPQLPKCRSALIADSLSLSRSNTGTYGAYGAGVKTVSIQAAIQHPLSRGSVLITSTSAFDAPTIDPGYLTHPADIKILRQAFKYAR